MIQIGEFALAEALFGFATLSFGIQIYEWNMLPVHRSARITVKGFLGVCVTVALVFWIVVTVRIMGEKPWTNISLDYVTGIAWPEHSLSPAEINSRITPPRPPTPQVFDDALTAKQFPSQTPETEMSRPVRRSKPSTSGTASPLHQNAATAESTEAALIHQARDLTQHLNKLVRNYQRSEQEIKGRYNMLSAYAPDAHLAGVFRGETFELLQLGKKTISVYRDQYAEQATDVHRKLKQDIPNAKEPRDLQSDSTFLDPPVVQAIADIAQDIDVLADQYERLSEDHKP